MSLVPASSHGSSGFVIGSSYLQADSVAQSTLVSGASSGVKFSRTAGAGSDLAVHAGGIGIDVATAGWYQIYWHMLAFANTGTFTDIQRILGIDPSPGYLSVPVDANGNAEMEITYPPFFVAAGLQAITPAMEGTTSAGTWSIDATTSALVVVRLA